MHYHHRPITHLIYDLDGLLLDTETLHEQANQTIARRYGKTFDPSIKVKMAGRTTQDSARLFVELLKMPLTPEEYLKQRYEILYPLYPAAIPLPGAKHLTEHFRKQGIPQAIASSSATYHFELKMSRQQDWLNCFECLILGDDPELQRSKPDPDIFLLAAKRLGANPQHCLVFEDSLAGIEAALAAKMAVVAVPAPHLDPQIFQKADQVLNSLEVFEPKYWDLPDFIVNRSPQ